MGLLACELDQRKTLALSGTAGSCTRHDPGKHTPRERTCWEALKIHELPCRYQPRAHFTAHLDDLVRVSVDFPELIRSVKRQ